MAEKPVTVVCVGMAGSGKTTFMQRINSHLHAKRTPPYIINLDPAVRTVPFSPNIDIRDSINYKEVMKQYNLGPNGGILTSLNLFATKIDQILHLLEKRTAPPPDPKTPAPKPITHILIDTPGQIEVFVWSASGAILLDSLASSFPTVVAYVVDTPRSSSTSTFMSNMLYACSILYKTKLPMILVFNKTDVQDAGFAKEWMTDFEAFQAALKAEEDQGSFGGYEGGNGGGSGGSGYMGSLLNSMSLMLEEFYRHLSVVGVSSMTGAGVDEFFAAVQEKAGEYERDYKPELERRQTERAKVKESQREKDLGRLMRDMNVTASASASGTRGPQGSSGLATAKAATREKGSTLSDMEDEMDSDAEAEMAEPDGDDDEDADDRGEEPGLEQRYKNALGDDGASKSGPSNDDNSFTRYLRATEMNG